MQGCAGATWDARLEKNGLPRTRDRRRRQIYRTPEVVAYLLGCRTRQILPAIEDYFVQKKGTKKGDMD